MTYTKASTLRDVMENPLGRDMLNTILQQTGAPSAMLQNPVTGNLTLGALQKLTAGKLDDAFLAALIRLLNNANELPPAPPKNGRSTPAWWKEAVVYQIYPRSFADANGDGIGDLAGILSKVPYLKRLGVDVLWLSPIYDSPNDDCGYDIRNYKKIMREFGTMKDFDALLAGVHAQGMKLIMDLVVNHTSDEHKWFKEAAKSRDNPYHDYYIWADGTPDTPPNNWKSNFSGSAWRWVPACEQWALHLFSKKQMDLNWENPKMRADIYAMMRWWLDKGVDGFRMDVINYISKDGYGDGSALLDAVSGGLCGIEHYFYGPHLHEYLREMHAQALAPYDTFTVGETPALGMETSKLLVADERGELNTVFNFDHLENPGHNRYVPYAYDLHFLKKYYLQWQMGFGANCWQSLFFDNHDNLRMPGKVTRDAAEQAAVARLLVTMQMAMRGTPFIFEGDELAMGNARFDSADELRDVEAINRYNALVAGGATPKEAMAVAGVGTRDHARTPMPWSAAKNAGFTKGTPWLKLTDGWETKNATALQKDKDSVWHYYKKAIALRHKCPALVYGAFKPVFTNGREFRDVFCWFRVLDGEKYYIECNLTGGYARRPAPVKTCMTQVLGTHGAPVTALRPYEANIYRIARTKR